MPALGLLAALFPLVATNLAEPLSHADRAKAIAWIDEMKANRRGPYAGVVWYCNDGAILQPRLYACVDHGGGDMYGVLSLNAQRLAKMGIHVGTVLVPLTWEDLAADDFYRAQSLVVEFYLERALDGWTLQSAKNYRGFRQVEDEEEAARLLLIALANHSLTLGPRRSLMVRLIRSLPYGRSEAAADEIRALAGRIGDADREFESLRFKIHAMPEPTDIDSVEAYLKHKEGELARLASELAEKMRVFYDPTTRVARLRQVRDWIWHAECKDAIQGFCDSGGDDPALLVVTGASLIELASSLLRRGTTTKQGERNLLLLHVMALVEELWVGATAPLSRMPLSRAAALYLARRFVTSAHHLGLLSAREEATAIAALTRAGTGDPLAYVEGVNEASRVLEWARAKLLADLGLALGRYTAVEPRAQGVIDDILRSGVMLPLATILDRLDADAERLRGGGHRLIGLRAPATGLRGENPGLATGPLRIVQGADASGALHQLRRHEIVLLHRLPPELPPVAGILTVGAAGRLSHVALLARNLGIPHATVTGELADALGTLEGSELLLGVSASRRVVLGDLLALEAAQRAKLGRRTIPNTPFLEIDANALDLVTTRIHPLAEISPADSGVRVGPKAAELGRLRALFPDRVSDAAVIPFGAFLRHVDQAPAEGEPSPLAQLRATYAQLRHEDPEVAETAALRELARFREAIATLPFPDGFETEVKGALSTLGNPGRFGVFIRSDTNVEDLKEFTGAGLNKTVANRVKHDTILAGIRKVWASPFTERSYRWRQRILKNPEHVYPSVILHRTVPSEMSGVLVTADLETGTQGAITVSISEGVAAVVDGGAPETVVIETAGEGGQRLLASPRSSTRKLIPRPPREGVKIAAAEGRDPLLGEAEIEDLRRLAHEVQEKIPSQAGLPWDIEFGFYQGKAFLMQIRPLRTSKAAATHPYLSALDAGARLTTEILDMEATLP